MSSPPLQPIPRRHSLEAPSRRALAIFALAYLSTWLGASSLTRADTTPARSDFDQPARTLHPTARESRANPSGFSAATNSALWPLIGSIAMVAGGFLCLAAKRRPNKYRAAGAPFAVVGRLALSPRHSIVLIQMDDRRLLVGIGPQGPPAILVDAPQARSADKVEGSP